MQRACAMFSSVVRPDLQYFSIFSRKLHYFRRKHHWTQNVCFVSCTTSGWNISHSKKKWARYDQKCLEVFKLSTRYSFPILIKLVISWQIFEKCSNNEIYRPVAAEVFHTDGRTEMTKLIVAFRNFANAPKNYPCYPQIILKWSLHVLE